ncbi:MAG: PPC domain-containing protein, partial [Sulfurovum sp.]|nr:PPC domain-containing protein [Sulfurovum sp.]
MVICSSIKSNNQLREIFIKKVIGLLLFFIATQAYTSEVSIYATPNDHGNSRNTATPINPNSITHGRIERARDSDYFKIVIPRGGGTLVVKTTGLTDTKGYLYTAGGGQIASDDNSGLDTNFKMTKRVRAGTYYVRVKHRNTSSVGNYMLVSQFTPNDHGNSRNTATPINPNSITHGRIERARDSDYFKIVIPRGGGILVV